MKSEKTLLSLLAALALAACSSTPNKAPVIEQSSGRTQDARPLATPAAPKAPDAPGQYTVKKGDTLIRIALDHGQNYRDLVAWNNLANPNDIKVDQVLRVTPPESGLTTGSVAVHSVPPPGSTAPQAVPNKNWPLGEKRPYSDATLAELQKAEAPLKLAEAKKPAKVDSKAPDTATGAGAVAAATPTPAATPAPAGSSASASVPNTTSTPTALSPEDEKIGWIWPADGKVIAGFDDGKSKGVDIAGRAGQQVLAAGSGKVMYAGNGIRGYGNLVIVKHSNTLLSAYAHNQAILVKEGQSVSRGQPIAEMGNSDSDTVKLHFEIRQQGKPVDPMRFLPAR
ncbi:peptidoglycan DD-metalloendopeptidase family protein [Massilia sp. W12]|uniref:peptidoglycan DD-metalloendopeptidase family protein n=1 Tax=Massilia sp. W12 TaxID=3126507 RepID=UPI0030D34D4F